MSAERDDSDAALRPEPSIRLMVLLDEGTLPRHSASDSGPIAQRQLNEGSSDRPSMAAFALPVSHSMSPLAEGVGDNSRRRGIGASTPSMALSQNPLGNAFVMPRHMSLNAPLPNVTRARRLSISSITSQGIEEEPLESGKKQLEKVLQHNLLEKTIFSLAYAMVRNNELPDWITTLFSAIEDIQLYAFAFSYDSTYTIPQWLVLILSPLSHHTLTTYSLFASAVIIALLLVFSALGITIFCGYSIHHNASIPVTPLRILRVLSTVMMSVFVIPIQHLLFEAVNCCPSSNPTMANAIALKHYDTTACFTSVHVTLFILSALALICFIPFILVLSLVFYDSSPRSTHLHARPNGHFEFRSFIVRLALVLMSTLVEQYSLALSRLTVFIGLLHQCYYITIYKPFYSESLNLMRSALLYGCLISTTIVSARYFLLLRLDTEMMLSQSGSFVVLSVLTFGGMVAGVLTSRVYSRWLQSRTLMILYSKQQKNIDQTVEGKSGTKYDRKEDSQGNLLSPMRIKQSRAMSIKASGATLNADNNKSTLSAINDKLSASSADFVKENLQNIRHQEVKVRGIFQRSSDVEIAIRFLRYPGNTAWKRRVAEDLIQAGLAQFPRSSLMHINLACYVKEFFEDTESPHYQHQSAASPQLGRRKSIAQSLKCRPSITSTAFSTVISRGKLSSTQLLRVVRNQLVSSFEVNFRMFSDERAAENERRTADIGKGSLSIIENAEFQNLERSAKLNHLRSLQHLRNFWEAVKNKSNSPQELVVHLIVIKEYQCLASRYYQQLLNKFPKSKNILRGYAQFLAAVLLDSAKASELIELADEVEESEPRTGSGHLLVEPHSSPSFVMDQDKRGYSPSKGHLLCPESMLSMQSSEASLPVQTTFPTGSNQDEEQYAPTAQDIISYNKDGYGMRSDRRNSRQETGNASAGMPMSSMAFGGGGGRTASDTSGNAGTREQRQTSKWKQQILMRVQTPLTIIIRMRSSLLLLLALAIGGYMQCNHYFNIASVQINQKFSVSRNARRIGLVLVQGLREIWVAAVANDTIAFAAARTRIFPYYSYCQNSMIPFLADQVYNTPDISIMIARDAAQDPIIYAPVMMNSYGVFTRVLQSAAYVYNLPMVNLQSSGASASESIRFMLDNIPAIASTLDNITVGGNISYLAAAQNEKNTLIIILSITLLITLWFLFGILLPMIKSSLNEQFRVLRLFKNVSKKLSLHVMTSLDEEVETLVSMMDDTVTTQINKDSKTTTVLPAGRMIHKRFIKFAWICFLGLALPTCIMYGVAMSASRVDTYTSMIVDSNQRRFYTQLTILYGKEVLVQDGKTNKPGEIEYRFRLNLLEFNKVHLRIMEDPNGISYYLPDLTSVGGTCHLSTVAKCNTRVYNTSIGFTQDVTLLPLNDIISLFLTTSQRFIDSAENASNLRDSNPYLQLLIAIGDDIIDGVQAVDNGMFSIINSTLQMSAVGTSMCFALAVISIVAMSVLIERTMIRSLQQDSVQLTALVFMVPPGYLKDVPQIKKFIETGGVIAEDIGEIK